MLEVQALPGTDGTQLVDDLPVAQAGVVVDEFGAGCCLDSGSQHQVQTGRQICAHTEVHRRQAGCAAPDRIDQFGNRVAAQVKQGAEWMTLTSPRCIELAGKSSKPGFDPEPVRE